MSRKNSGKSTSKKYSSNPPKASAKFAAKPAIAAAVEIAKTPAIPATAPAITANAAVVETVETVTVAAAIPAEVVAIATQEETVIAAAPEATAPEIAVIDSTALAETSQVQSLIASLGNGDADTAREAATTLGTLGDTAAVEPLIAALNNVDGYFHAVVRAAAAFSLAQLGDLRAVESLLNTITDSSAELSAEAIRGLATLGDASAVDALIDVTRNRAGFFLPIARHAAVLALAKLGGENATAELLEVANDSWENHVVRDAAQAAVGQEATATSL